MDIICNQIRLIFKIENFKQYSKTNASVAPSKGCVVFVVVVVVVVVIVVVVVVLQVPACFF